MTCHQMQHGVHQSKESGENSLVESLKSAKWKLKEVYLFFSSSEALAMAFMGTCIVHCMISHDDFKFLGLVPNSENNNPLKSGQLQGESLQILPLFWKSEIKLNPPYSLHLCLFNGY